MIKTVTTKVLSMALATTITFGAFAEATHARTVEFRVDPQELESASGRDAVRQRISDFAGAQCRDARKLGIHGHFGQCKADIVQQLERRIEELSR